jgi:hypothetical protein
MSKHDLQARPTYHRTRDAVEAHLNVVFAAMAVSHRIKHQTGWSIEKFVRTAHHQPGRGGIRLVRHSRGAAVLLGD